MTRELAVELFCSVASARRPPHPPMGTAMRRTHCWANSTVIGEDPAVAVPRLKQEPGDPLRVIGSMSLGCSLIQLGLVDRLFADHLPAVAR